MARQLGFSLLALCAILTSSAQAAGLTGSIGFTADAITADGSGTGNILTSTVFTFATNPSPAGGPVVPNTQSTTAPATGSFAGVPDGTIVQSTPFDLSAPGGSYLTLSLNSDSFTATTLVSDSDGTVSGSRTFNLLGDIAGPGFTTTQALFVFTFTQAGPGDAISYSGTLAAVPEPGSMVLMGMGLIGVLGVSRRRLGRLSRLSA